MDAFTPRPVVLVADIEGERALAAQLWKWCALYLYDSSGPLRVPKKQTSSKNKGVFFHSEL